ncbi:MAG: hypothetical protein ABEH43_06890 [Flavobacteriales bacterium]
MNKIMEIVWLILGGLGIMVAIYCYVKPQAGNPLFFMVIGLGGIVFYTYRRYFLRKKIEKFKDKNDSDSSE